MPLTLTKLNAEHLKSFEALYQSAFPAREKLTMRALMHRIKRRVFEALVIEQNDVFKGLVVTALDNDKALIFYFAIHEDARGQGLGTLALRLIKERYAGMRIFLEIEDPAAPCDNKEQRTKREHFYLRNGFRVCSDAFMLYGTQMKLLCVGKEPTFKEYAQMLRRIYGLFLSVIIRPKRLG